MDFVWCVGVVVVEDEGCTFREDGVVVSRTASRYGFDIMGLCKLVGE